MIYDILKKIFSYTLSKKSRPGILSVLLIPAGLFLLQGCTLLPGCREDWGGPGMEPGREFSSTREEILTGHEEYKDLSTSKEPGLPVWLRQSLAEETRFRRWRLLRSGISFTAAGDLLLDRGIRGIIRRSGSVDHPYDKVRHLLLPSDITFCNLESPVSTRGEPLDKLYCFRGDPEFLDGTARAGINLVTLANNHILDYGREALLDTLTHLKERNILYVGAGKDIAAASAPVIIEEKGVRLGFLGYVDLPAGGIEYRDDKPGPATVKIDRVIGDIEELRGRVDHLIVTFHWGIEYVHYPREEERRLARASIDAGADMIIGHHPHVLQGIEIYKERIILYSLGNFIFDQHRPHQQQSLLFNCYFTEDAILFPALIPLSIRGFRPVPATDREAEDIFALFKEISCPESRERLRYEEGIIYF